MRNVQKSALIYLLVLGAWVWGIAVGGYGVFPARYLEEIEAFVEGHELETESSVAEKVEHEVGLEPTRFLGPYPKTAIRKTKRLKVPGLRSRREAPAAFIHPKHQSGYRVIFGGFDFEDAFWGGILLGPSGKVLHTWKLSTEAFSDTPDVMKKLYGVHLTPNGSVVFTQQEEGNSIVRVDACSKVEWHIPGVFHHTITPAADDSFWTFRGKIAEFNQILARYSMTTGKSLGVINMEEVQRKNPKTYIFHLEITEEPGFDASHGNDIEPLDPSLAEAFPQFEAGDLLVSYRTHNLVFVLDPDTLKIKWWRVGPWDRQHDPDWEPDGRIAVFSNNPMARQKFSDIIAIDPRTMKTEVAVRGSKFDFFSSINGDHQLTDFETRMVTSTTQGWAFEVDERNRIVFSFLNLYEQSSKRALQLSEAQRLPKDYFSQPFWEQDCAE